MTAPNPLAARRRTNSSSLSGAVPSSWEESVVSGAIANRFAICSPLLNLRGDQTTIDQHLVVLDSCFVHDLFGKPLHTPHQERGRLFPDHALVNDAPGVDDDGLAGHGLAAAHRDHHVGAVVLVRRLLQE